MERNEGMENMIKMINNLQDKFIPLGLSLDIELPQIAVVGGQSAGKSSVLESFVGKDFLPRGNGIVTRRPLVLQLIPSEKEIYGEFLHAPNRKFYDFSEIRREIENETYRIIGNSNGVSSIPISLKIYSPHVVNLTLVDLPGLTKLPVANQPQDIESQLRKMVLDNIKNDNCLILAVTPATQDLATSDALQIAKEVDPNGDRTIGVLTKLDLMDKGTDAREILDNNLLPLQRGYIGVINRSQKDIETNKSIESAVEYENDFFSRHEGYSDIANKMGTKYLQKYLNIELSKHIFSKLSDLRHLLGEQQSEIGQKLEPFNEMDEHDNLERTLNQFSELFRQDYELEIGRSASVAVNVKTTSHGPVINGMINDRFQNDIKRIFKDESELLREISKAIQNIHGVHQGIFPSDMAFEAVIRLVIDKFTEPSMKCIDNVTAEVELLVNDCTMKLDKYPKLRDIFTNCTCEYVRKCQKKCKEQMAYMVSVQKAYMNTNHDDFIGAKTEQVNPSRYEDPKSQNKIINNIVNENARKCDFINYKKFDYWFVLASDKLYWYKDKDEKEMVGHVSLSDLHISSEKIDKKIVVLIIKKESMFSNKEKMELKFRSSESADEWRYELEKIGIKRYDSIESIGPFSGVNAPKSVRKNLIEITLSNHYNGQVETIKTFVDSYIQIIKKTFRDFVPKLIYHAIIDETRKFIAIDLRTEIKRFATIEDMMTVNNDKAQKKDLTERYDGVTDAMKLIDYVISNGNNLRNNIDYMSNGY